LPWLGFSLNLHQQVITADISLNVNGWKMWKMFTAYLHYNPEIFLLLDIYPEK
jgi:hypothetical protein